MKISVASGNEDKSCRCPVEDLVVKYHETKTYEEKKRIVLCFLLFLIVTVSFKVEVVSVN